MKSPRNSQRVGYLMDPQRRYELKAILDRLGNASSELRGRAGEEETTFKLMPENMRQSPRAIAHQETSERPNRLSVTMLQRFQRT